MTRFYKMTETWGARARASRTRGGMGFALLDLVIWVALVFIIGLVVLGVLAPLLVPDFEENLPAGVRVYDGGLW